jgi:tRNA(Arg) A34 adenosine deaminase TadA
MKKSLILTVVLSLSLVVCANVFGSDSTDEKFERDRIFSLLALSVVYKDWQTEKNGRGHNIGSVLVNMDGEPVFWARNTSNRSDNGSQHGEVRLIQQFLNCDGIGKYVDGYTVYTTLEPCAMCTGMMTLTQLTRVVYVQRDPGYGGAQAALVSIKYPKVFQQDTPAGMAQKDDLDADFAKIFEKNDKASITDFLRSERAKDIFASAEQELSSWKEAKYSANEKALQRAKTFLQAVPGANGDDRMSDFCPVKPK